MANIRTYLWVISAVARKSKADKSKYLARPVFCLRACIVYLRCVQANHSAEVGVLQMGCCFALMQCCYDRWSTRKWTSFFASIDVSEVRESVAKWLNGRVRGGSDRLAYSQYSRRAWGPKQFTEALVEEIIIVSV